MNTLITGNDAQLLTRLNCAYGLAELATGKYKSAAKHFLLANIDHCGIPDLMSAQVSDIQFALVSDLPIVSLIGLLCYGFLLSWQFWQYGPHIPKVCLEP